MYSKNDYRNYLEHRLAESDDFLMHWGIKGMKWRNKYERRADRYDKSSETLANRTSSSSQYLSKHGINPVSDSGVRSTLGYAVSDKVLANSNRTNDAAKKMKKVDKYRKRTAKKAKKARRQINRSIDAVSQNINAGKDVAESRDRRRKRRQSKHSSLPSTW